MERERKSYLQRLEKLDRSLQDLTDKLDVFSESQLNEKPLQTMWSPMEVLYHIYRSEKVTLQYMKKKLSFDPRLKKYGLFSRIRSALLNFYLRSRIKVQAPPMVRGEDKPAELTYADLKKAYHKVRRDMREFFETVDAKWFDREVFRHPLAGRISLGQTISYLDNHFERHKKQMLQRVPVRD